MSFTFDVFSEQEWPSSCARLIARSLPESGAVIATGGTSAGGLYPELSAQDKDWSSIDVLFSDERCVPPEDPASNYGMVRRLLLDARPPRRVFRMRGEDPAVAAAERYEQDVSETLDSGVEVAVLGMGSDCHIAALFPQSPALQSKHYCAAVRRPDGLEGITLTPRALLRTHRVYLVVTGSEKAQAVRRAVRGGEEAAICPVKVLVEHPKAKFLLDEPAAESL